MKKLLPFTKGGTVAARRLLQRAILTAGFGMLLVSLAWQIRAGAGYTWAFLSLLPMLLLLFLTYRACAWTTEGERENRELVRHHMKTVETLALAVDVKDPITYGHVRRMRGYARELARLAGVAQEKDLEAIEMAAMMHDIGKLAVDEAIITKPGPLTAREFEEVKRHSEAGSEIIEQIESSSPVASFVRSHHERWDGLGYPDGLKGEDIPFGARVLAIVDAFDASRSSRPFRLALDTPGCLDVLEEGAGTKFDPALVRLFVDNIGQLEQRVENAGGGMTLSFARAPEEYRGRAPDTAAPRRSPSLSLEMSSLGDFCKGPALDLEMNDLLAVIASRLGRLVPNDTCVIFVRNGGSKLYARSVTGLHAGRLCGAEMRWGQGISGWVAAHKSPILNSNPSLDFDDLQSPDHGLQDALSVPVVAGDHCVGAITLYALTRGHFNSSHLELLQDVAQSVAHLVALTRFREGLSAESGIADGESRTFPASHFTAMASAMINSARDNGTPLSLVCADFETPGSVRPDRRSGEDHTMLRRIAAIIRAELRDPAAIFYFGTHRLVALLEGVDAQEALLRGSRMQLRIRNTAIGGPRGPQVACQVGVASLPGDGVTLKSLLEAAERRVAGAPATPPFLRARRRQIQ